MECVCGWEGGGGECVCMCGCGGVKKSCEGENNIQERCKPSGMLESHSTRMSMRRKPSGLLESYTIQTSMRHKPSGLLESYSTQMSTTSTLSYLPVQTESGLCTQEWGGNKGAVKIFILLTRSKAAHPLKELGTAMGMQMRLKHKHDCICVVMFQCVQNSIIFMQTFAHSGSTYSGYLALFPCYSHNALPPWKMMLSTCLCGSWPTHTEGSDN